MNNKEKIKSEYNESPYPWDSCYDHIRKNPSREKHYKIKRRIKQPIYDAERVKSLAKNKERIILNKHNARRCASYGINLTVLSEIIANSLSREKYKDSEWCRLSNEHDWYAADAYTFPDQCYIHCNEYYEQVLSLYIKLSITLEKKLCTISCHPS